MTDTVDGIFTALGLGERVSLHNVIGLITSLRSGVVIRNVGGITVSWLGGFLYLMWADQLYL